MRFRITRRRLIVAITAVTIAAAATFSLFRLPWTVNVSASMPLGIYRTSPVARPFERGDRIVVCPPPAAGKMELARGYAFAGPCPGGVVTLIKVVGAVAGDAIEVRRNGVYVDGIRLANSRALRVDGAGRPLPVVPLGRRTVPPGQLWLWTPEPSSFDSRYYGLVPAASVRSFAHMLVPFAPWPYSGDLPPERP